MCPCFWLPARWAFGFSGDHHQNIQCINLQMLCLYSCMLLIVFLLGIKLLLLFMNTKMSRNTPPWTHFTEEIPISVQIPRQFTLLQFDFCPWDHHMIYILWQHKCSVLSKALCWSLYQIVSWLLISIETLLIQWGLGPPLLTWINLNLCMGK